MIPLDKMPTESRYLFEFATLERGELIHKPKAQSDWYREQGLPVEPRDKEWTRGRLAAILADFQRDGREPRWLTLHPDLPPALVGEMGGGDQVVVQVRAHFDFELFLPVLEKTEGDYAGRL